MADMHVKRCSKSVVMREAQIKTTARKHCTSIGMVKIKETDHTRCGATELTAGRNGKCSC